MSLPARMACVGAGGAGGWAEAVRPRRTKAKTRRGRRVMLGLKVTSTPVRDKTEKGIRRSPPVNQNAIHGWGTALSRFLDSHPWHDDAAPWIGSRAKTWVGWLAIAGGWGPG